MSRPNGIAIAAHLTALPAVDPEADTAEIEVLPPDEATTALSRHAASVSNTPPPWPVIWLATTLLIIAVLAVVVITTSDDRVAPPANDASGAIASTPTRESSTTTVSTTVVPSTGSNPAQEPPASSPAATCADLDAHSEALDIERHQVQETYRHDPDTREELKRQLSDEKQAVAAQKQALGC